jgi:flagellar assembly protein FliH
MQSKLMPRSGSVEAQPLTYRSLDTAGASGVALASFSSSAPRNMGESKEELHQLRSRITELELALAQQVAAARQIGYREGELAGRGDAESKTKPVLDRLARSLHELVEWKPRLRKELEHDAVQLSLAIAKRILRRELNVDPAALQGLIQVAFERMGRNELARVIVHPDHVAGLRETLALLTTRQIEISGDSSKEKGTLVFETTRGALDASVDTQLREIELGLTDRLKWR